MIKQKTVFYVTCDKCGQSYTDGEVDEIHCYTDGEVDKIHFDSMAELRASGGVEDWGIGKNLYLCEECVFDMSEEQIKKWIRQK